MTTLRNYILTILTLFCTSTLFAQNKVAIINDSDGFTNMRSGQGKGFPVIAKIDKEEFFYCNPTTRNKWVKVIAMKENKQIEGYIYKSKIQLVENLDRQKKRELIIQILNKQRILAKNFQNALKGNDTNAYKITREELEQFSENKYFPILEIFPIYFCSTSDTNVLQLLFSTMWADKGTVSEMPSISISDCFICKPNKVIEEFAAIKNIKQKKFIIDNIEWEILKYLKEYDRYPKKTKEYNEQKKYKRLKARLDKERKSQPITNKLAREQVNGFD